MRNNMQVMAAWLESCEALPLEQKKEIYYHIIRYGIYGEEPMSDDVTAQVALNFIMPQIKNMQNSYDNKVKMGETRGRKKLVEDEVVWRMAHGEKKSAATIAEELGINIKTIYSTKGWKERNNPNFLNSENNSEIPKKNSENYFDF